jgi:hypothetical protein
MSYGLRKEKGLKFYELRARDTLLERFEVTIWPPAMP